jgi:FKBP12-rapamycin complex-associated protein
VTAFIDYHDRDLKAMFDRLDPRHAMMTEKGPQTMREIAFEQSFGSDLRDAYNLGKQYRSSKQIEFLNQAWERYYNVGIRL